MIVTKGPEFTVLFFENLKPEKEIEKRVIRILRENIDRIEKEDEKNKEACRAIKTMPYRLQYIVFFKSGEITITIQAKHLTRRIYKLPEDVKEEIAKTVAVAMI